MFQFVQPVTGLLIVSITWLVIWVSAEVWLTWQAGEAVNQINAMEGVKGMLQADSFLDWLKSDDPSSVHLRHAVLKLAAIVLVYGVLRYLREVANSKMSMRMVFYIREAVYDKLQRVGFGFHDAISSGQLINRSLTDLQNVRGFVQTAILTTLEILLVVGGNIILIYTISPWVAALSLLPLPIWTLYILRFSRKIQPVAKSVMEAHDRSTSIVTENIAGVHVVKLERAMAVPDDDASLSASGRDVPRRKR